MHVQTENKISCLYIYVCWKQVDECFSFWKNNNWHCLCLSPSLLLKKKLKGADQSCPCGRFWQLHLCGWKLSRTRKRHEYNQRADLWEQLISICPSVYVLMFVLIYRSNTSDHLMQESDHTSTNLVYGHCHHVFSSHGWLGITQTRKAEAAVVKTE